MKLRDVSLFYLLLTSCSGHNDGNHDVAEGDVNADHEHSCSPCSNCHLDCSQCSSPQSLVLLWTCAKMGLKLYWTKKKNKKNVCTWWGCKLQIWLCRQRPGRWKLSPLSKDPCNPPESWQSPQNEDKYLVGNKIENVHSKKKKKATDCFAIWRVKGGVLPHCETVGLVSTLGNQVIFCK